MKKKAEILALISLISQIGIMMALPIIFCILLGNFLDKWLNTGVLFLIVFSFLGVGAAFRNLFVIALKGIKARNMRKDEKDE
ncbi:AtpZ/AtpI family protein [Defluviitalea saccharophila]|uniref:AtpZ/AtpI family protein n=1 Tax=Defluviitalea saccharophila TaxID=879970 RepID=A0ABZ2Y0G5_9FIRM